MPARRSPIGRRISIHALREEGDNIRFAIASFAVVFLSTPSVRRATSYICPSKFPPFYFYPRPP